MYMSRKTIVEFVGQPGSGKSELCRHLEARGFATILYSDLIREYALPRDIELKSRRDYSNVRGQMLRELGHSAFIDPVINAPSQLVNVDGVRTLNLMEHLQRHGAVPIALHCPLETRYERAVLRGRELDKPSLEAFAQDEAEEYYGETRDDAATVSCMEAADYHIDSSRPLAEVKYDVDRIVLPLLLANT
jgi:dephospho-CoA kinase